MEYDDLMVATFNDINATELDVVREQLNETIRREGKAEIVRFIFDGPEDIIIDQDDRSFMICFETTMDELLQMCLS